MRTTKSGRLLALSLATLLAASVVQAADKVKIGFVSTLSGPNGALGAEIRDAFNLAVKLNGGKLGGLPVRRLGEPADVARAAGFFVQSDASFITGQVLYVCGGASVGSLNL